MSIRVPECDIIFLIPLNFHEQLKKYDNSIKSLLNSFKKCGIVQNFEIPIDVKNPNELDIDLRLLFESDDEYFDIDYLKLRRFGRAKVDEVRVIIPTRNGDINIEAKVFLTVFEVGIGILAIWFPKIPNMYKEDIIDFYFIKHKKIKLSDHDPNRELTMLEFVKDFAYEKFGSKSVPREDEILEDMFTMIFIKGLTLESSAIPYDFIEKYKEFIFDILTFPERYYDPEKKNPEAYIYYKSRTKEYVSSVLRNISVRNDFPVFVSNNRFLGLKIVTGVKDYSIEKRIMFNLALYSNAVLQLKLLKNINDRLSGIIKSPRLTSMGALIKMREDIFRDLEEYINTSIQRYEVWKKAVQDAMEELGIPELYNAVKERLNMLDSYISSEHQRSSERLFYLLNTFVIISATLTFIEAFYPNIDVTYKILTMVIFLIFWVIASYRYIQRYIR